MKLKIVLELSDDGGFTAYVPSLPGCISEGESCDEALRNIREAIELYLEQVDDDLAGKEAKSRKSLFDESSFSQLPLCRGRISAPGT
jgi:predicted RNase H-like HicB family nuclease